MVEPVDTKKLKEYTIPTDVEPHISIVHPPIAENNFDIKPSLVGMVQQNQFSGLHVITTGVKRNRDWTKEYAHSLREKAQYIRVFTEFYLEFLYGRGEGK